jgi:hypothetical protein
LLLLVFCKVARDRRNYSWQFPTSSDGVTARQTNSEMVRQ